LFAEPLLEFVKQTAGFAFGVISSVIDKNGAQNAPGTRVLRTGNPLQQIKDETDGVYQKLFKVGNVEGKAWPR
jgi:hypothetical protein